MRYSKLAFLLGNLWLMLTIVEKNNWLLLVALAWFITSVIIESKEIKVLSKKYGDKTKNTDADKGENQDEKHG